MQILFFSPGVQLPDPFRSYAEKRVQEELEHLAERLTRVEVHLKDVNSKKGGVDKHCVIEAHPRGMDPVAAEHEADDPKEAVTQAAIKLQHALRHRFDRRDDKRKRPSGTS